MRLNIFAHANLRFQDRELPRIIHSRMFGIRQQWQMLFNFVGCITLNICLYTPLSLLGRARRAFYKKGGGIWLDLPIQYLCNQEERGGGGHKL